jgi:hypothetical protein
MMYGASGECSAWRRAVATSKQVSATTPGRPRLFSQTTVLESPAVLHRHAVLVPDFSLSEHSLETAALMCYRCAEF